MARATHCPDCGRAWELTYYDPYLIAERSAELAKEQGWRLSPARVLYILHELPCVERSKYRNGGIAKTPRVRIHSLDATVRSVIDYHKMRESVKRLGGK